jgi:YQGE family putative transporter
MLTRFKQKLSEELKHFHELSYNARDLTKTFTLYEISALIVSVFSGAFIFSQLQSNISTAIYYFADFVFIPIAFYVNGFLLKRFHIKHLFYFGTILTTLSPLLLVTIPLTSNLQIFVLGALYGFGVGSYWIHRNYITIDATTDESRNYFFGIYGAILSLAGIIVPGLSGYFISFTKSLGFNENLAYLGLMFFAFLSALGSIYILRDNKFKSPKEFRIFGVENSRDWWLGRLLAFSNSIRFGLMLFIPTIIVLEISGREDVLGGILTLASFIAVILSYTAGKKLKAQQRFLMLAIASGIFTFGAISFGILYSLMGVILLLVAEKFAGPLKFTGISGIWYKIIDNHSEKLRFAYLCDLEVWINLGRLFGVAIFIGLSANFATEFTLKATMLLLVISEFFMIILTRMVTRE